MQRLEDVPIDKIDLSDSHVHDLSDFGGKGVTYDDIVEGFRKLETTVRPHYQRGSRKDFFRQMDLDLGHDYAHGYLKIYEVFYGDEAIVLSKIKDTYSVTNGYHRLFVARLLNIKAIPARVVQRLID